MICSRLPVGDELSLRQVYSLLGHVIDRREWDRLDEIFTRNVVLDASAVGFGRIRGVDSVRATWAARLTDARSHHATNVVVATVGSSAVSVIAKGISMYGVDDVRTVTWFDDVIASSSGWRIARRVTVRGAAAVVPLGGPSSSSESPA